MESQKASLTALICAYCRAYHSLYESPKIFDDFLARQLFSQDEFDQITQHHAQGIHFFNPEEAEHFSDPLAAAAWVRQTQFGSSILARSRYCEDMLLNAQRLGTQQYVQLGAGFDTYAFRQPSGDPSLQIFEIDHPATQTAKLERVQNAGWQILDNVHFLPVDFSQQDFAASLLAANFSRQPRTFFSWLGVTYYLSREEIFSTLSTIARLSPKGSAVVFDYPDPSLHHPETASKRVANALKMVNTLGEPMKSGFSVGELERLLQEAGLLLYEHLSPSQIEQRYFQGRDDFYHAYEDVSLALAVVQ